MTSPRSVQYPTFRVCFSLTRSLTADHVLPPHLLILSQSSLAPSPAQKSRRMPRRSAVLFLTARPCYIDVAEEASARRRWRPPGNVTPHSAILQCRPPIYESYDNVSCTCKLWGKLRCTQWDQGYPVLSYMTSIFHTTSHISQSKSFTQHIRCASYATLPEMPLGTPRIASSYRQAGAHMPVPIPS